MVEQRGHWEVKLGTVSSTHGVNGLGRGAGEEGGDINSPLLDAGKLTSVKPTSFICASCSLPLVQIPQQQQQQQGAPSAHSGSPRSSSTTPSPPPLFTSSTSSASSESSSSSASSSYLTAQPFTYRDLPSEHWEELVEAWMCHSDQKLHDQVVRHGKAGFWPAKGQAYVGGSYVLFEESVVVKQNLLGAGAEDKVCVLVCRLAPNLFFCHFPPRSFFSRSVYNWAFKKTGVGLYQRSMSFLVSCHHPWYTFSVVQLAVRCCGHSYGLGSPRRFPLHSYAKALASVQREGLGFWGHVA